MKHIEHAKQLRQASRDIDFPFSMDFGSDVGTLIFEKSLRLLPGKRLTALAQWQGKTVVAKLFYHPQRWQYYGQRDAAGVNALMQANMATPKLLFQRAMEHKDCYLLLIDYLPEAVNLSVELTKHHGTKCEAQLIETVITTIAKLHQWGLRQNDLHLDNFLWQKDKLYTIDGSDIVASKQALSPAASLSNLGLLFAHLPITLNSNLDRFIMHYCVQRGWEVTAKLKAKALKVIRRQRKRHLDDRAKKVFRNCTEFLVRQDVKRRLICRRNEHTQPLQVLLNNLEQAFAQGDHCLLKRGNTCTIMKTVLGDRQLVIKRYNIKGFWHGLRRGLRTSRAAHSWRNAHLLQNLGIKTANPIALVEKRWGYWRRTAYLVTDYVAGPQLMELLANTHPDVVAEVIKLLNYLAEVNLSHGDLKATNFIVADNGVHLIDLDSMKQHRLYGRWCKARNKDIQRFLQNWTNVLPNTINVNFLEELKQ